MQANEPRAERIKRIQERYRQVDKRSKSAILSEFCLSWARRSNLRDHTPATTARTSGPKGWKKAEIQSRTAGARDDSLELHGADSSHPHEVCIALMVALLSSSGF